MFRPLALGDVDHSTHKLNHLTRVVADRVGDAANVFYGTVWKNDAVVVFGVVPLVKLSLDPSHRGSIVGMHPLLEAFCGWVCSIWVETKDLKSFDRPENSLGGDIPSPTTCVAKPLRLRQVCLALSQCCFRLLCRGDVHHSAHIFKVALRSLQRATQCVNLLDSTGRHQQAMLKIEICLFVDHVVENLPHAISIVGMNSLEY